MNTTKLVLSIVISLAAFLMNSVAVKAQNNLQHIPDPDPGQQLEMFQVADGFEVNLFASEPMVVKPIQMNWDAAGRLWVVSSTVYPHLKSGELANDKIYVLEDTDGDGTADKSTVFAEGLLTPTGILPGDGGVYVANSTEILFLKDTDGDGKADLKRKVLTGFGTGDTHHLIHTFRWGPEGLMYFNQSIYIFSHIETPWGVRRLEGGGVWQLRPETLELDVYARGLINPWGLQFNRWGQSFLTDGAGSEGINYAFPGATFITAPRAERIVRGLNPGQPKHSGLEIISGRHLPESWEGGFLTNDFRANRINRFTVQEQGSGYATQQAEDLMWTDHVAFRPVDISIGPDGAIYVADWYNPIIQHGEVDFFDPRRDQQHGRIWRIKAKDRPLVHPPALATAGLNELLDALKAAENWTRSQAKQMLKQKGAETVGPALGQWVSSLDASAPDFEHHLLEALWVYQSLDLVNAPLLRQLLQSKDHNARAAAVRILSAWEPHLEDVDRLLETAAGDEHPRVRLEALSAIRHLKPARAASTALSVLDQPMDEFLDFGLWQTLRELEDAWAPKVLADPGYFRDAEKTVFALLSGKSPEALRQLLRLFQNGEVPEKYQPAVLEAVAKRGETADLNILLDIALADSTANNPKLSLLHTLERAARERKITPDQNLHEIERLLDHEQQDMVRAALKLIGLWKYEAATGRLAEIARKKNPALQQEALAALAAIGSDSSYGLLTEFAEAANAPSLRLMATAHLVNLDPGQAAISAVDLLRHLPGTTDVTPLFSAFLSSKENMAALAHQLSEKKIPEEFAKTGRQILQRQLSSRRADDPEVQRLREALEASGGTLPPDRMPQNLSASEVRQLAQQIKTNSDPILGEAIYRRTNLMCQHCHAIGGAGGLIGPDLSSLGTSSPIDNIIQSLLDPNESIKEGYELQRIVKKDGSMVLGYQIREGATDILIRNAAGVEQSVQKDQIDTHETIPGSLMPPGLTSSLEKEEFNNLVAYLSELGKTGEFRAPNASYVRRWATVTGDKRFEAMSGEEGIFNLIKEKGEQRLLPVYSTVSGALPIEELPVLEFGSGERLSLVQFELEVLTSGKVALLFNTTAGIAAWAPQGPLTISDGATVAELSPGIHQMTVALDRKILPEGQLKIELKEATTGPAQFRLVMGK